MSENTVKHDQVQALATPMGADQAICKYIPGAE
jgi:hypothetical protein